VRSGLIDLAPPGLDGLERRLNAPDRAPVAVALSGGGDSLALLHLAQAWSRRAGRPLVALTVDHGLQATSAEWCAFAADRAARLGVSHRTLAWTGAKPTTGLPAAARAARHRLLTDAARAIGARVVLMGHTADDLLEALEMRRQGSSVPIPTEWSPSPAWPEGRGVFLLRPLLAVRRAELRALLSELGERWIDDPANDDPRFARAAARLRLAGCGRAAPPPSDPASVAGLDQVIEGAGGDLAAPRGVFATPQARRLLGAMILCAAGSDRPPRRESLDRLLARLAAGESFTASLAGARIEASDEAVTCLREAGERARGGLAEQPLPLGESVFDGRVAITASQPGWRVAALRGATKRLPGAEQRRLSALPASVRGALPVAISPAGDHSCPIVAHSAAVAARPLGLPRLRAALGALADEAALWRVAKPPMGA
jgi:tRNA(Ile)-lysidine synthase